MATIPLDRLAAHIGATLDETVRAVKISLFSGVIRDTRVDTGRLRGNWQTTTGAPAGASTQNTSEAAALSGVQSVTTDRVDYLTNNLPYAAVWEEKDGMVARNVARIERTIREQLRS